DELRSATNEMQAPSISFSDVARKVFSIINLSSVAAIEGVIGRAVHPLRFRGNVYVTGWPAWCELDLVGREIAFGTRARLRIIKRSVRFAATTAEPETGIRILAIL